jgi:micrococcal nuclease
VIGPVAGLVLAATLVVGCAALGPDPATGRVCTSAEAVDGDTLHASCGGAAVTVRVVGVDTPETVHPDKAVQCYGPEASKRAHALLDGQSVTLTTDRTQGEHDRYGRTLAYVEVGGRDLGAVLITEGLAREYNYGDGYEQRSAYRKLQGTARSAGLGLWAVCPR